MRRVLAGVMVTASPVLAIVFARLPPRVAEKISECGATGCWFWEGGTINGYGAIWFDGEDWMAHRLAWTLAYGPIPNGCVVRHDCNIRSCMNPTHLLIGDHRSNGEDMMNGTRQSGAPLQPNGHTVREFKKPSAGAMENVASTEYRRALRGWDQEL